jgi:hypothetical protein
MNDFDDIISSLTPATLARHSVARSTRICKICGQPAIEFRSELSQLEYRISAICQCCQDRFWGSGEEQ